jgi:hypothetical protein
MNENIINFIKSKEWIYKTKGSEIIIEICPFCKGRATKIVSLNTGKTYCQQCDRDYTAADVQNAKDNKRSSQK